MKTFKDIKEEFELLKGTALYSQPLTKNQAKIIKEFLKEISNQIIDECIGEEMLREHGKGCDCMGCVFFRGWNVKRKELKDYKLKFNK